MKTDYLVIGSGIAGLNFAIKAAVSSPEVGVVIVCKSIPKETNTRYAQGGIAIAMDKSDIADHISDTLAAGGGYCDPKVVSIVVNEARARLKELEHWGIKFDRTRNREYDLIREGGHKTRRILHRGDFTGLEIERKLLAEARKYKNIRFLKNTFALELIISPGKTRCEGALVFSPKQGKTIEILAGITFLATGGMGQVFEHTTNPRIATGDGIAMAHRAGARIRNMAFIQFHPTALYEKDKPTGFLISEAVRGQGALLRNEAGILFMKDYDPKKELATRDVVSRAIRNEISKQELPYVSLDCREIPKKVFQLRFPVIYTKCMGMGIDPSIAMIPVTPAAHYCCGGIHTDHSGATSVKNLYAGGECAHTGLHGANRLASNSLLEALVFSHRSFVHASRRLNKIRFGVRVKREKHTVVQTQANVQVLDFILELKKIMTDNISVTTSDVKLKHAASAIEQLKLKTEAAFKNEGYSLEAYELNNMLTVAALVVNDCRQQTQNAGTFFNTDLCPSAGNPELLRTTEELAL